MSIIFLYVCEYILKISSSNIRYASPLLSIDLFFAILYAKHNCRLGEDAWRGKENLEISMEKFWDDEAQSLGSDFIGMFLAISSCSLSYYSKKSRFLDGSWTKSCTLFRFISPSFFLQNHRSIPISLLFSFFHFDSSFRGWNANNSVQTPLHRSSRELSSFFPSS